MFEKSQILRATTHQHINLKQSLKIDIHKFWMSNMHKICGSRNYIEIVIINSSRYYNMFSYINLGFYQTWDEFLRELQLIHKSQLFIFWKIWFFMIFFNLSKYELFWRTHTWKSFFPNLQILNVFLHTVFQSLDKWKNAIFENTRKLSKRWIIM